MAIGIEKFNLYAGQFALDIADLAKARNMDATYVRDELRCEARSVFPKWEDPLSIAVNAAKPMLSEDDINSIGLLIVGTESALDFGKPISSWVHRYLKLPASSRNFEVKHACYSGTAAMRMALSWLASAARPGQKALVIATDISRSHLGEDSEVICGGCATALLLSHEPKILKVEVGREGLWAQEIADTFRPTSQREIGDNSLSLCSYLDALEGSFQDYEQLHGATDLHDFSYHIYHAPFPGMTFQAHRTLLRRLGKMSKAALSENFQSKVQPGLQFARLIGSAYGSSNFLCLMSLLSQPLLDQAQNRQVSIFSYGSGCQSEFYSAELGEQATELVASLGIQERLQRRHRLTVQEYEGMELQRDTMIDRQDFQLEKDGQFAEHFAGKGLLVLDSIQNYRRQYLWS